MNWPLDKHIQKFMNICCKHNIFAHILTPYAIKDAEGYLKLKYDDDEEVWFKIRLEPYNLPSFTVYEKNKEDYIYFCSDSDWAVETAISVMIKMLEELRNEKT